MRTINGITTPYNLVVPWVWYTNKLSTNTWENWNNTWWDHYSREFEKNKIKKKETEKVLNPFKERYKITIWHNIEKISTEEYLKLKNLLN